MGIVGGFEGAPPLLTWQGPQRAGRRGRRPLQGRAGVRTARWFTMDVVGRFPVNPTWHGGIPLWM